MYFIKIIEIIQKYNVVNLRNYILKNYKLILTTLVILMLMRLLTIAEQYFIFYIITSDRNGVSSHR